MITPIPIFVDTREERCPKCNREEDIREVCGHCGYEYKDDGPPVVVMLAIMGFIMVFGVWFIVTTATWFASGKPLLDVLIAQWDWLTSLRLW